MSQAAQTIIKPQWIAQFTEQQYLTDHAVVIENDKIIDILPSDLATTTYPDAESIELPEHLLIPGLINTHNHAAMSLFRGIADDLPLMTWLNDHIWPAEGQWVSPEFVRDGTLLACAEMLKCGTTTFSDMYFFPEEAAIAVQQAGMKAQLCTPIMEFPTAWGSGPQEYLEKTEALIKQFSDSSDISIALGPHAPYTVSDETFKKSVALKDKYQCKIQVHLHETQFEVDESLKQHSLRPVRRLKQLGVLSKDTQCVHMTALTEEDITDIAQSNSHVMHCPESNLKLASGFCPVAKLQNENINVTLGTDGAASNNDLDMIAEMRTAALLAKANSGDATALNAINALAAATINGAKALGMDDKTGSIETGKLADLVAIDLSHLHCQPVYNPISQLVYTARADQVTQVWSNGRRLIKDGSLTELDETALINNAKTWKDKIHNTKD
jgi:5-methylthioadenosine/S-adenosylhomocysteine deaminase